MFVKRLNVVGDYLGLTGADGLEQIRLRHEGHPLLQRLVGWGEMPLGIEIVRQAGSDAVDKLLFDSVRVIARVL